MLITSGMNSVFTLLFFIMSVAVVITDDSAAFVCGGKEKHFKILQNWAVKKADK